VSSLDELRCTCCDREYSLTSKIWKCSCGGVLDVLLDFSKRRISKEQIESRYPSLWRYREFIPVVDDDHIVSFSEGFTPLSKHSFGSLEAFLKTDYLFPTGSFKDRGSTVLVSKARELGIQRVVEDSSGNAGASIAAYCAKAGIDCHIYVPSSASVEKTTQIQTYGARITKVAGSRKDAANHALKAAGSEYYASHSWNPFFIEGTKTLAFEISEQLGWRSPNALILPVGSGTLLLGAYKGFRELESLGFVDKVPRMLAVQSENCPPIYEAFKKNFKDVKEVEAKPTIAEGISVARPVRGNQVLTAIRNTDGNIVAVSDFEVVESLSEMGKHGYFIEPTSAATIAALHKFYEEGEIDREETIVVPLTGTGLKAVRGIACHALRNDIGT